MSHSRRSHRYLFVIINFILLLTVPAFAGDKVKEKRFFVLDPDGTRYEDAGALCAAEAKERGEDESVDNPYDEVVGQEDKGSNVWCKLADSNGNEIDQHYGAEVWECPANSQRINDSCECAEGYKATGDVCEKTDSSVAEQDENTPAPYVGDTRPYDPKKTREDVEQAHVSTGGNVGDVTSTTVAKKANQRVNDNEAKGVAVVNCRGNKAVTVEYADPFTGEPTTANIPYNERDLPIFDDVAIFTAVLDREKSYEAQKVSATQQLKAVINSKKYQGKKLTEQQAKDIQDGKATIGDQSGYTWHHNGETKNMQLIPTAVHGVVSHVGERALCGGK